MLFLLSVAKQELIARKTEAVEEAKGLQIAAERMISLGLGLEAEMEEGKRQLAGVNAFIRSLPQTSGDIGAVRKALKAVARSQARVADAAEHEICYILNCRRFSQLLANRFETTTARNQAWEKGMKLLEKELRNEEATMAIVKSRGSTSSASSSNKSSGANNSGGGSNKAAKSGSGGSGSKRSSSSSSSNKTSSADKGPCRHCGRAGHSISECWDKDPSKKPKHFKRN